MLTRQTWTAAVSAVVFVAMAALLALVPVPFVSWAPGSAYDVLGERDGQPVVSISGIPVSPVSGRLNLTTVSVTRVDASLSLPEALLAHLLADREVLPRQAIYPPGQSSEEVKQQESQMMVDSQRDAIVAALREAGVPVSEMPAVSAVTMNGPSYRQMEPGDLIVAVDQFPVATPDEVRKRIQAHKVGDKILFSVLRNKVAMDVTVTAQASNNNPGMPAVGMRFSTGYSFDADVKVNIDPAIGGPSAGLVFALAIYDKITPSALIDGRNIAGTGTITASGDVGAIGGIREKIVAARSAGASIFLVPAPNCDDVKGLETTTKLIPVTNLRGAITALIAAKDPSATLPTCDG